MTYETLITHNRNIVVIKWYFFAIILSILAQIVAGRPIEAIASLAFSSLTFALISFIFILKKKFINSIKYLLSMGVSMVILSLILFAPSPLVILLFYFSLALLSFYGEIKPILFTTIFGIILNTFAFIHKQDLIFLGGDKKYLVLYNALLLVVGIMLSVQAKHNEKLRRNSNLKEQEANTQKQKSDFLLGEVSKSISAIDVFSIKLKKTISETENTSEELTNSVDDIVQGITHQTKSIEEITQSIYSVDENIKLVSNKSKNMVEESNETLHSTNNGFEKINLLNKEVKHVEKINSTTINLMKELNNQNDSIESIIETISNIADQTNLLSLNASIEAARVGEHGRGFAVVADEVKKLAQLCQESTNNVSNILNSIKMQTIRVTSEVELSKKAIANSINTMNDVHLSFVNIERNSNKIVTYSNEIETINSLIESSSSEISNDITSTSHTTEQIKKSSEEILARVKTQNDKVSTITKNFTDLEKRTKGLKDIFND